MSSHAHQLKCVKGEIHKMLSAMRLNQRWASSLRFKREVPLESERDELKAFKTVLQYVETFSDLRDIDTPRYLGPFLRTIRSKSTSGAITGVALGSVNKFLLYGFITSDSINARAAINAVARAICDCRFEATDPDGDEVVLMKLLELVAHCLRSAAGPLLSPHAVWAMGQTCFQLSQQRRASMLLRQTARNATVTGAPVATEHTGADDSADQWGGALEGNSDASDAEDSGPSSMPGLPTGGAAGVGANTAAVAHPHDALLERLARFLVSLVNPRLDVTPVVEPPPSWHESWGWRDDDDVGAGDTDDLDASLDMSTIDGSAKDDALLSMDEKLEQVGLGLTLINVVLETAGESLTAYPDIVALLQSDLCKFLLQNSQTDSLEVLSLTLRVVFNLFNSMKNHLKVQLEVFFTSVHLRISSTPISTLRSAEQKELALESLLEFCREPALMLDLYVNYDTDVHCTNLFETLLQALAQKIDRLMEAFAAGVYEQNKGMDHSPFADADAAFVLTFALIMLHTDLHNNSIPEEKKMKVTQFFRNCEGINAGKDLPKPFLEALYYRIKTEEIHMMQDIANSSDAATTATHWDGVMARTEAVAGATFTLQTDSIGFRAGIHEREMFSLMNEGSIGGSGSGSSSSSTGALKASGTEAARREAEDQKREQERQAAQQAQREAAAKLALEAAEAARREAEDQKREQERQAAQQAQREAAAKLALEAAEATRREAEDQKREQERQAAQRAQLEAEASLNRETSVPAYAIVLCACRFISKSLVETGAWEPLISRRLLARLALDRRDIDSPGAARRRIFVDVGANIGWFALLAAAHGYDTVAVEPMERNVELLRASAAALAEGAGGEGGALERSVRGIVSGADGEARARDTVAGRGVGTIVVHKTAVSDSTGAQLHEMCVLPAFDGDPLANSGNGQLHELTDTNRDQCTDIVRTTTLDELLSATGPSHVFAMKLDIEGFETRALRGARALLGGNGNFDPSSRPCFVFAEHWAKYARWSGVRELELFELMFSHGYQAFAVGDQSLQVTADDVARDDVADGDYEFRLRAPHCPPEHEHEN
eukprot:g2239.t1